MALNPEEMSKDVDATLLTLRPLAERLQGEIANLERTQGGITPQQLQQMVGELSQAINPNMEKQSLIDQLRSAANDLEGDPNIPVDATLWVLMSTAMHLGYLNVLDVYQATYDNLDILLENNINLVKWTEHDQRLGTKTEGEGE